MLLSNTDLQHNIRHTSPFSIQLLAHTVYIVQLDFLQMNGCTQIYEILIFIVDSILY